MKWKTVIHVPVWVAAILSATAAGLLVAVILKLFNSHTDYLDRQEEIASIRDVIVSGRLNISKAQAGSVVSPIPGRPGIFRKLHRSREEAQLVEWQKLIAKLSDVLEHKVSRITFEEKRELRMSFPGIEVDGKKFLGDGLDIIIRAQIRMHYKDMFSSAERIIWLELPPVSQEVMDRLIPADRLKSDG